MNFWYNEAMKQSSNSVASPNHSTVLLKYINKHSFKDLWTVKLLQYKIITRFQTKSPLTMFICYCNSSNNKKLKLLVFFSSNILKSNFIQNLLLSLFKHQKTPRIPHPAMQYGLLPCSKQRGAMRVNLSISCDRP